MSSPRVSVLLTTYRRPDYLRVSLASALAQTWDDLEVVIAEDGGPAYAAAVAREADDPRVRCLRNPETLGVVPNVRRAARACRGRYVAILNDDDAWEPEFLSSLVPRLEADASLSAAFSDHFIMDGEGEVDLAASDANTARWRRASLAPGRHQPFWRLALVDKSLPTCMAAVLRREAIDWEALPDAAGGHYDLFLAYLASRAGGAAWYEPRRLTRYRVHAAMETRVGSLRNSKATAFCYATFAADPRLAPLAGLFRRRERDACVTHALALLRAGRPADARAASRDALRGARPGRRALATLALTHLPGGLGAGLLRLRDGARR